MAFTSRITVQDLLPVLDATCASIPDLDPSQSGLTGFIQMYTETRMQLVHSVVERWNQSIDLFMGVGDIHPLDQTPEHTQAIAKIHKGHMHFLLKTLTLFEYKAVLVIRFHASLIARVNQHNGMDGGRARVGGRESTNERHPASVTRALEASFTTNAYVSRQERDRLRSVTGLTAVQIMIWFTNKRRRIR